MTLSNLSWGTEGTSHTELGNPQIFLEVLLGRTRSGREGVGEICDGREGRDIRYDRDTLGADPGENNLSRCCSEALRGCEDWFVNWATGVAGDRADEISGQSIEGKKTSHSSHT
jgi:hypothetical protein